MSFQTICAASVDYELLNFPDSIDCNRDSTFSVRIKNMSNDSITLRKLSNPIEIYFNKSNVNIDTSKSEGISFAILGPGKEIIQPAELTPSYLKDTIVCPDPNYNNCSTKKDSVLATLAVKCHSGSLKYPISKGTYKVTIYINITEKNEKRTYYRIVKNLRIK